MSLIDFIMTAVIQRVAADVVVGVVAVCVAMVLVVVLVAVCSVRNKNGNCSIFSIPHLFCSLVIVVVVVVIV